MITIDRYIQRLFLKNLVVITIALVSLYAIVDFLQAEVERLREERHEAEVEALRYLRSRPDVFEAATKAGSDLVHPDHN